MFTRANKSCTLWATFLWQNAFYLKPFYWCFLRGLKVIISLYFCGYELLMLLYAKPFSWEEKAIERSNLHSIFITWGTPNEIKDLNTVPKLNSQKCSQGVKIHGFLEIASWAVQLLHMDFTTMTTTTDSTTAWGLFIIFWDQKSHRPSKQEGRCWQWRTRTWGDFDF